MAIHFHKKREADCFGTINTSRIKAFFSGILSVLYFAGYKIGGYQPDPGKNKDHG